MSLAFTFPPRITLCLRTRPPRTTPVPSAPLSCQVRILALLTDRFGSEPDAWARLEQLGQPLRTAARGIEFSREMQAAVDAQVW